MKMLARTGVIALTLVVAGCGDARFQAKPIATAEISEVLIEIKRQISVYAIKSDQLRPGQLSTETGEPDRVFNCGNGDILFPIKKVRVALNTKTTNSVKGTIGAAVGAPVVSLGAGVGYMSEGTQELALFLYPDPSKPRSMAIDMETPAPVSQQLLALRDAMIISAQAPGRCWHTNPVGRAPSETSTYKLGLQITKSAEGRIGVGLAPVELGVSGEAKSVTGNEMIVTFEQPSAGSGGSSGVAAPPGRSPAGRSPSW